MNKAIIGILAQNKLILQVTHQPVCPVVLVVSKNTFFFFFSDKQFRHYNPLHIWLPNSFFSNAINVLLICPLSPEPRQKQLIDNSSISELGGLPRALRNFQSISDHYGSLPALFRTAFQAKIAVAAV